MLGKCGLMRSSIVTVASELNAEEMVLQQNNQEKTKLSVFFVIGKWKKKMFYTHRTSQKKLMYLRAALNKHAINSPGSPGSPCSISMTKYITICGEPKVHSAFQFHQIYNYCPVLAAKSFGIFDPQ